jgi:hypothetical protein
MSLTISPGVQPPLSEIALQERLVEILKSDPAMRKTVQLFRSKKEVGTLNELLGEWTFDKDFDITLEPELREGDSELSVELFQGMRPDIVLRSKHSGQNRIIIETKQHTSATPSQFLAYFLHLLVTSDKKPNDIVDIPRGFFLAAPSSWFKSETKSNAWHYLVNRYGPLADQFNIILGEIRAEDL